MSLPSLTNQNMKAKFTISKIITCTALLVLSACSKEQSPADTQTQNTKPADSVKTEASKAVDAVQTEAAKAADALKTEATKAVDASKSTAQQVSDKVASEVKSAEPQAQQQAQGLIDKAKSLVGEQKYQEAMTSLSQLGNLKLTPDQQKIVDGLKAQIQSALAKATTSDAASAIS
jgi:hypothetical protein